MISRHCFKLNLVFVRFLILCQKSPVKPTKANRTSFSDQRRTWIFQQYPKCGHVFHTKCIMYWFQNGQNNSFVENLDQNAKHSGNNCPKCRKKCSNIELIKTYFDMETKTTSLNPFHGICWGFISTLVFLAIVLSALVLYLHHQKEKNKNEYTRLKEFNLGCYMWNEKLWMGNAPLKPKFSECGIDVCTLCRGKSIPDIIIIKISSILEQV